MPRYRKASVYLRNGRMWRKPGRTILDDIRQRSAAKAQDAAADQAREEREAREALDALQADVAAAKARRTARQSG